MRVVDRFAQQAPRAAELLAVHQRQGRALVGGPERRPRAAGLLLEIRVGRRHGPGAVEPGHRLAHQRQARLGLRVGEALRFGLQIARGRPGQRDQLTLVAGPLDRGRDGERRLDRRARFHVLTELAMGQRDDAPEGSGFSRGHAARARRRRRRGRRSRGRPRPRSGAVSRAPCTPRGSMRTPAPAGRPRRSLGASTRSPASSARATRAGMASSGSDSCIGTGNRPPCRLRAGSERAADGSVGAQTDRTTTGKVRTAQGWPVSRGPQQLHDAQQEQPTRNQYSNENQRFFAEHPNH